MHLVRYRTADGDVGVGVRAADGVVPTGYADMLAFIEDGEAALAGGARRRSSASQASSPSGSWRRSTTRARCSSSGMTYDVFRQDVPIEQEPYVYARVQSSIVGPGDDDPPPDRRRTRALRGRARRRHRQAHVPRRRPPRRWSHVFGYTQANDVTWTQWVHGGTKVGPQICLSKNADTFCPLGPDIVTADELDPVDLDFTVDGQRRGQDELLDDRPRLDHRDDPGVPEPNMTLWPGDLVSTGTCEAKDIVAGDVVTVEFDGLGRLENPVAASW